MLGPDYRSSRRLPVKPGEIGIRSIYRIMDIQPGKEVPGGLAGIFKISLFSGFPVQGHCGGKKWMNPLPVHTDAVHRSPATAEKVDVLAIVICKRFLEQRKQGIVPHQLPPAHQTHQHIPRAVPSPAGDFTAFRIPKRTYVAVVLHSGKHGLNRYTRRLLEFLGFLVHPVFLQQGGSAGQFADGPSHVRGIYDIAGTRFMAVVKSGGKAPLAVPAPENGKSEIHVLLKSFPKAVLDGEPGHLERLCPEPYAAPGTVNILAGFQVPGLFYLVRRPAVQGRIGVIVRNGVSVGRPAALVIACAEHLVIHYTPVPVSVLVLTAAPVLEGFVQADDFRHAAHGRGIMAETLPRHGEDFGEAVVLPLRLAGAGQGLDLERFPGLQRYVIVISPGKTFLPGIADRAFAVRPVDDMPERAVGELFHGAGTHV